MAVLFKAADALACPRVFGLSLCYFTLVLLSCCRFWEQRAEKDEKCLHAICVLSLSEKWLKLHPVLANTNCLLSDSPFAVACWVLMAVFQLWWLNCVLLSLGDGSAGRGWAQVYQGVCERLLRGSARNCHCSGPLCLCSTSRRSLNAGETHALCFLHQFLLILFVLFSKPHFPFVTELIASRYLLYHAVKRGRGSIE